MKSSSRVQSNLFEPGKLGLMLGLVLYLAAAVLIAYWIGNQEQRLLIYTSVVALFCAGTFGLQRKAWVLIPLVWVFAGYTGVLSIPLSLRDMAILLAASAYLCYRIVGHQATYLRMTALDWVLWLNIIYIGITFLIHPVGFWIFHSEMIGGRPYISILLAVVAYVTLTRSTNSQKSLSWLLVCLVVGAVAYAALYLIAYLFPSLLHAAPILFAAVDIGSFSSGMGLEADVPRYEWLGTTGLLLVFALCSYYRPRTLLNPLRVRFWFFLVAVICIGAAGYRHLMLWAMAALVVGSWLHRGWSEVCLILVCGVACLGVLVGGQGHLYNLPKPVQRSLTFLPGQWESEIEEDAKNSSEGRFQWWRDIIKYKMIKNWWVGDGFGARAEDLQSIAATGQNTEFMMTTGGYHSGPLTAIRYVGMVGLVLLYALMITTVVYAVIYVRRTVGTTLHPVAVFVAIQCLWIPIHYTFLFGAYQAQVPEQIFLAAILRCVIRFSENPSVAETPPPVAASPVAAVRQVAAH